MCACFLLRLSGLWVMPEGNVILVGTEKLEVAAACNGLSMLMSLAAHRLGCGQPDDDGELEAARVAAQHHPDRI